MSGQGHIEASGRNVGRSRLPRVIVLGQNGVCYSASRVRLMQARQRCADPPPPASPANQATAKSSTANATYKLDKFHRSNHRKLLTSYSIAKLAAASRQCSNKHLDED